MAATFGFGLLQPALGCFCIGRMGHHQAFFRPETGPARISGQPNKPCREHGGGVRLDYGLLGIPYLLFGRCLCWFFGLKFTAPVVDAHLAPIYL